MARRRVAEPVRAIGLPPVPHVGQDRQSMCLAGSMESPLPTWQPGRLGRDGLTGKCRKLCCGQSSFRPRPRIEAARSTARGGLEPAEVQQ